MKLFARMLDGSRLEVCPECYRAICFKHSIAYREKETAYMSCCRLSEKHLFNIYKTALSLTPDDVEEWLPQEHVPFLRVDDLWWTIRPDIFDTIRYAIAEYQIFVGITGGEPEWEDDNATA